jgi:hypothetical protein
MIRDSKSSNNSDCEDSLPFLPLEENDDTDLDDDDMKSPTTNNSSFLNCEIDGKKIVSAIMFLLISLVIWDTLFRDPEHRWIKPDFSERFLVWVQAYPARGLFAFLLVIATGVVLMIPVGTPLTIGCGYVYKGAYGWIIGVTIATVISMVGSALGAVTCFLLGRYLMRDQVRKWIRKYPLFDAIDSGTYMTYHRSLHGLSHSTS